MTRLVFLAAVLLLASAAHAAKKAKPAPKVEVSSAAAGSPLPAYAPSTGTVTLELVSARFAELDAAMRALRADFKQFVRLDGSDTVQQVEGEVRFRKPDLLRLTHRLPETQTVVADGTWLWVHRPSTNQVIKTKLEDWRRSEPLAKGLMDFGRSADMLKRYATTISTVSAPGADGQRVVTLTLLPRPEDRKGDASDFELTLRASTRDWFPGDASLRVGRAVIRSQFENVRLNPELPDETFRFEPPKDADVFTTPSQSEKK